MPRLPRPLRPGRPGPRPAARRPAFRLAPERLEGRRAWTDNASTEDGSQVEESLDGTNLTQVGTAGRNVMSHAVTELLPSLTYSFRARASNAAGTSAPTSTAMATTPSAPAPPSPSNLAAMFVNASQINLSWEDNSTLLPPEDGFKLYRSTDGVTWTWFATVAQGITAYTWWGAAPGTTYSFRVTAYNAAGESAPSNTATVTTPVPPAAPSNVAVAAASGSGTRIDLTWTDNASNANGFKVYASTDGILWAWFATAGPNVTAFTWWGAAPGTTYYFRVTAYNAAGESAPSNTATVTTPS